MAQRQSTTCVKLHLGFDIKTDDAIKFYKKAIYVLKKENSEPYRIKLCVEKLKQLERGVSDATKSKVEK